MVWGEDEQLLARFLILIAMNSAQAALPQCNLPYWKDESLQSKMQEAKVRVTLL